MRAPAQWQCSWASWLQGAWSLKDVTLCNVLMRFEPNRLQRMMLQVNLRLILMLLATTLLHRLSPALFSSCLLSKAKARCCSRIMAEINSATTTPQKLIRCNRQPIKPQSIHWGDNMCQRRVASCRSEDWHHEQGSKVLDTRPRKHSSKSPVFGFGPKLGPRPTFWIHNGLMSLMHKAQKMHILRQLSLQLWVSAG